MATIDEVLNTYMQIDLVQIAKDVVTANEQGVLDINRNQLRFGFDSDGNYITPEYYYARYARYKQDVRGTKAPWRTPDLLDTGAFYKSLRFDKDFKVYSVGVYGDDGEYSKKLEDKYGKDSIYGFDDKNLSGIRAKYVDEIKKLITNN
jgi:hypothetical protein